MKKIVFWLILISILILFSGCTQQTTDSGEKTGDATTVGNVDEKAGEELTNAEKNVESTDEHTGEKTEGEQTDEEIVGEENDNVEANGTETGAADVESNTPQLTAEEIAVQECEKLCKAESEKGTDLSNGPCLSDDNPEWNVSDWVCDIAHDPRADVDNIEANQCKEFGVSANHFVEFSPECEFIKKY